MASRQCFFMCSYRVENLSEQRRGRLHEAGKIWGMAVVLSECSFIVVEEYVFESSCSGSRKSVGFLFYVRERLSDSDILLPVFLRSGSYFFEQFIIWSDSLRYYYPLSQIAPLFCCLSGTPDSDVLLGQSDTTWDRESDSGHMGDDKQEQFADGRRISLCGQHGGRSGVDCVPVCYRSVIN